MGNPPRPRRASLVQKGMHPPPPPNAAARSRPFVARRRRIGTQILLSVCPSHKHSLLLCAPGAYSLLAGGQQPALRRRGAEMPELNVHLLPRASNNNPGRTPRVPPAGRRAPPTRTCAPVLGARAACGVRVRYGSGCCSAGGRRPRRCGSGSTSTTRCGSTPSRTPPSPRRGRRAAHAHTRARTNQPTNKHARTYAPPGSAWERKRPDPRRAPAGSGVQERVPGVGGAHGHVSPQDRRLRPGRRSEPVPAEKRRGVDSDVYGDASHHFHT
jgi:hypothetical protein